MSGHRDPTTREDSGDLEHDRRRVRYLDQPPPAADVELVRSIAYAVMFAFATRAAAVFLLSLSTIALRSRTFPTWIALTGYLLGAVLLVVVVFWDWIVLVLPAWVAVVSLFILRRDRSRRGRSPAGA